MFRLRRNKDNYYVTNPGSHYSYSPNKEEAREFPTREDAEGNRCSLSEYIERDGIRLNN